MAEDLLRAVEGVLARSGYGPQSGLRVRWHGSAVSVTWHADRLIRPTIEAHATDPDLRVLAGITGMRTALDSALVSVLGEAGLTVAHHPEGFVLVTRPAPTTGPGGG